MAKAEWGAKRRCLSCGAAFYDLNKSPILCPKCGTEFNPEVLAKSARRPSKTEEKKVPKAPVPAETSEDEIEDTEIGDEILEDDADEFEEDGVTEEIDVETESNTDEER